MISVSGSGGNSSICVHILCLKWKIVFNTHNLTIKIKSLITNRINKQRSHDLKKKSSWMPNDNCFNYQIYVFLVYFYLVHWNKTCKCFQICNNIKIYPQYCALICSRNRRIKYAYFIIFYYIWNQWLMRLQKHSLLLTFTFNHELPDKYRRREIFVLENGLQSFAHFTGSMQTSCRNHARSDLSAWTHTG